MDINTNILPFIGTFAPAAFYALIIYVLLPKKSIPILDAPLFFIAGICAVLSIRVLYFVLPFLCTPFIDSNIGFILQNFCQVALFEEIAKMIMFILALRYFNPITPQSTIFMYMSLGCGFAAAENFSYMLIFGPAVLIVRTVTAVLLHMSAGILAGRMWLNNKPYALLLPVILHGTYNTLIVSTGFYSILIVFACIIIGILSCSNLKKEA